MGMNAARTLLAGFSIALLATGCGGDDDSGGSATTKAPAAATTTAPAMSTATTAASGGNAAQTKVTVAIKDFKFDPDNAHVPVGATVTWTNNDDQDHTATSDREFDTGPIKPGESKTVTFDHAGTFKYHCSIHRFMTGTVVVG